MYEEIKLVLQRLIKSARKSDVPFIFHEMHMNISVLTPPDNKLSNADFL